MRVRRSNHLGTRRVHLRVDGKRRSIDGILSLDHVAAMIHQNQVGRANLPEVYPERVHPEVVEPFRIARRDVSRHAFIESETRKEPEGRGQHPLAMYALLRGRGKLRRPRDVQYIGGCSRHWTSVPRIERIIPVDLLSGGGLRLLGGLLNKSCDSTGLRHVDGMAALDLND